MIVGGVLGILLFGWMLVALLPAHAPLSTGEKFDMSRRCVTLRLSDCEELAGWRFKPGAYRLMQAFCALMVALGVSQLIRGATWRKQKQVRCRKCGTDVVGDKTSFGIRCPVAPPPHLAKLNGDAIAGLILLGLVPVAILIGLSRGSPTESPRLQNGSNGAKTTRSEPSQTPYPAISTGTPTPKQEQSPVVDKRIAIPDGQAMTWTLPGGTYRLDVTATNGGVTVRWKGGHRCPQAKSRTLNFSTTCTIDEGGRLIVGQSTLLGGGRPSDVHVLVRRW